MTDVTHKKKKALVHSIIHYQKTSLLDVHQLLTE